MDATVNVGKYWFGYKHVNQVRTIHVPSGYLEELVRLLRRPVHHRERWLDRHGGMERINEWLPSIPTRPLLIYIIPPYTTGGESKRSGKRNEFNDLKLPVPLLVASSFHALNLVRSMVVVVVVKWHGWKRNAGRPYLEPRSKFAPLLLGGTRIDKIHGHFGHHLE